MNTEITKDILATGVRVPYPSLTSCSHLIYKAYKFRIYPNAEQRELLAKHFGCCRFVYNHFLEERNRAYKEEKKYIGYVETANTVAQMKKTEEYGWLKEVYSHALQAALRNLDTAYRNFFKGKSKAPVFHGKHDKQTVTFPDKVKVIEGKLVLPKFESPIKMKMHRELCGKICHATVIKDAVGNYYVSIMCKEDCKHLQMNGKSIGIDVGIKDMAVCSNGERISNPKFLEKGEKHLKFLQRRVSRKKKGGQNHHRARLRLSRHHEKVRNRRNDYIHKVTSRIVRENQAICCEDLNVKGMMANHNLAKSIGSVAFGEIARQLEYKSRWYGRGFVKIPRFYPSSKRCNHCGYVYKGLKLSDREWECPNCHQEIDRDFNASLNIEDVGLAILSGRGVQSDIKQKGVEATGMPVSMNHRSQ